MSVSISAEEAKLFTLPIESIFVGVEASVEVIEASGEVPEHLAIVAKWNCPKQQKQVSIDEPFDLSEMVKTTLSPTEELRLRRANQPIPANAIVLTRKGVALVESFAGAVAFEMLDPYLVRPAAKPKSTPAAKQA